MAAATQELPALIGSLSDRLSQLRASPNPADKDAIPAIIAEFRAMEGLLAESAGDASITAGEHAEHARLLATVRAILRDHAPAATAAAPADTTADAATGVVPAGSADRNAAAPAAAIQLTTLNGDGKAAANGKGEHAVDIKPDAKDGDGKAATADGKDGDKKGGDKKDEKKEPPPKMPFTSLFRFAERRDKVMIAIAVVSSVIVGAAFPVNSIVFGELINTIGGPDTTKDELVDEIVSFIRYVGLIAAVVFVAGFLEVTLFVITSERQTAAMRLRLLRAIMSQPVSWFDTQNAGALTSRMNDTSLVQDAISDKVGTIIQYITQFVAGLLVGFIYGWQLTLVILSLSPLLVIAGGMMGRFMQTIAIRTQAAYAAAAAVADETILNPRTVQAFGAEERETQRYAVSLAEAMRQGIRNGIVGGLSLGFMFMVMFGSYGLALWYGAQLVRDGVSNGSRDYTGGDVTTVFMSVMMGSQAFGQMAPQVTIIAQGQAAAWYLFRIVDQVSPIDVFSDAGKKLAIKPPPTAAAPAAEVTVAVVPANGDAKEAAAAAVAAVPPVTPKGGLLSGKIEFENVHFTYATNPTKPILRGLSLTIEPGQKVALVGASGCGKSTVISLLERFYDPKEGTVRIDGVDLRDLNVRWWREQVGLVSQEPVLFAATVKDNIAYGKPGASDADIIAAARAANCHDFITALPDGYSTMVGDKGKLLSGGQKQRIAIARGLLKNPPLLLLDEATSALDAANEKDVQLALDVLMGGRTTIIIAHRLSTIRDVDRIFVVADGVVREAGNHRELMAADGAYARLVEAQEQKSKEAADAKDDVTGEAAKKAAILELQKAYLRKSVAAKADDDAKAAAAASANGGAGGADMKQTRDPKTGKPVPVGAKQDPNQQQLEDEAPVVPMWRMVQKSAPDWMYVLYGVIGAAAFGAVFPLFSFLLSGMIEIFYYTDHDAMRRDARDYALYFLAMACGIAFFVFTMQWAFGVAAERLTLLIRTESYRAIMRQNIGFFDEKRNLSGILVTRLSHDAAQVQNAVNRQMATFVQMVVMLATGLTIALYYGWKLALVILAVSPLIVFGGSFQFRGIFGFNQQSKLEFESANRLASEAIGNIRTVVSFTSEAALVRRFGVMLDRMVDVGTRSALIQGTAFGVANAVVFAVYCLAFWYGSTLIRDDEMTFAEFLKVYFAVSMTATSIGRSTSYAPDYVKARRATYNIFALLDRKPPIDTWDQTGRTADFQAGGGITFRDVGFEYPTRPDVKVFRGLNLTIEPRTTVALVGASGCGKSTIVQLLQRFYDPTSGTIEVDGQDVRALKLSSFRERIGIVSQEPVLFTGTIRDNICYGCPNATDAEVHEAARSANIHNFIMSLKDGYNSRLGAKGLQLSGGEKQRVAIARAIIKKPTILLLDEATSALDSASERDVQAAINQVMVGRTTVVVAHRLSTIRNAHKIVVFEHGVIREMGTHDRLIDANGLYASLWALSSLERDPNAK